MYNPSNSLHSVALRYENNNDSKMISSRNSLLHSRNTPPLENRWASQNTELNMNSKYDDDNFRLRRKSVRTTQITSNLYPTYRSEVKIDVSQKIELNKSVKDNSNLSNDVIKPIGLPNSSTYCFMNSVVQCLRFCTDFVVHLLNFQLDNQNSINSNKVSCINNRSSISKKESIDDNNNVITSEPSDVDRLLIVKLCNLINDLAYNEEVSVEVSSEEFQKLHSNYPKFSTGEQDADEYLQFLLDKINDVTKNKKPKNQKRIKNICTRTKIYQSMSNEIFENYAAENDSIVTDLFCGQMNNYLLCNNCMWKKPFYQIFLVLSLPIINTSITSIPLLTCFEDMMKKEKVDIEKCEKCQATESMTLQTIITKWPRYLVIYIKRNIDQVKKIVNRTMITMDINEKLNFGTYTVPRMYVLKGVIDHLGSIDSGHYFAKFKALDDINVWWSLNDTCVDKIENPANNVITGDTVTYVFKREDYHR